MKKNTTSREKATDRGFTLVELLIVVAIISILAAIAIPQFTKYRLRGYKAELDSDIKNAYNAAQAYLTDNNLAIITTLGTLRAGGYTQSPSVTLKSSNIQIGSGSIVLGSTPLKSSGKHNNSVVLANGRFNMVNVP